MPKERLPHMTLRSQLIASIESGNWRQFKQLMQRFYQTPYSLSERDDILNQTLTPLLTAAHRGLLSMVTALLQAKANPNTPNSTGETPLHLAAKYGHISVVDQLIKYQHQDRIGMANLEARTQSGYTPLHYAVANNQAHIGEHLIEMGADLNATTNSKKTGLMLSLETRNYGMAKALLSYSHTMIEYRSESKRNALFYALNSKLTDFTRLLLQHRASPNTAYNSDDLGSPLNVAVRTQDPTLVALLLAANANPNGLDNYPSTPLSNSVELQATAITAQLLEAKACVTDSIPWINIAGVKDPRQLSLLLHALQSTAKRQATAWVKQCMETKNIPVLRMLCRAGIEISGISHKDFTPLSFAARHNEYALAEDLLAAKADINKLDDTKEGDSPMHWAVYKKHFRIGLLLNQHQADLRIVSKTGRSLFEDAQNTRGRRFVLYCYLHRALQVNNRQSIPATLKLHDNSLKPTLAAIRTYSRQMAAQQVLQRDLGQLRMLHPSILKNMAELGVETPPLIAELVAEFSTVSVPSSPPLPTVDTKPLRAQAAETIAETRHSLHAAKKRLRFCLN